MLLQNKNAIIYAAGGSLGGAVAKALAAAGARVFLASRNLSSVQKVADEILASGGLAEVGQVDAMDEKAINSHINHVVNNAGTIDISFNAIPLQDLQNIPLVNMAAEDFMRPVTIAAQSHFLTATAAGRAMMKQGSGVILSLTATPAAIGYPLTGGFGTACSVIESFSRILACELGVYGIRVVNIRSGGSPDSMVFKEAIARNPEGMALLIRKMEEDTMLKKMPLMADIANAAVFLASDMAGKITGVTLDITAGTTTGLNYKMGPIPFK
jgi:NAD(P)-dependent dehydrogenase (short-subunit alcohol dehydrogenase family)